MKRYVESPDQKPVGTPTKRGSGADAVKPVYLPSRALAWLIRELREAGAPVRVGLSEKAEGADLRRYAGFAVRDGAGRTRGAVSYRLRDGGACGRSLDVENFLLVDPTDDAARAALLMEIEEIGRALGCDCAHVTLPDPVTGFLRLRDATVYPLLQAGYERRSVRLCKRLR